MRKGFVASLLAGVLAALPYAGADAAPQVLAALPSDAGIPFTCDDSDCRADINTYCLLRNRPAPILGTEYVPAVPERFTLVVTDAQGRDKSLPAVDHLRFYESRGFMAVAAQISRADLARLGAVKAAIRIAAGASLLPVPVAGDPNPLTEKEIAYATGSLRAESAEMVERRPEAATARLLSVVSNRLSYGKDFDTGEFEKIWSGTIDSIPAAAPERGVIGPARAKADACIGDVGNLRFGNLRQCLELKQDELIRDLNVDYWNSRIGS